jgi:hypothetical protein
MVTYLLWLESEGDSQPSSNDKGIAYSPVEIGHGFSVMLKQAETDGCLDVGLPPGYKLHSYLWDERGKGAYRYDRRVYDQNECSRWSCIELREALEGIQSVVYATIFGHLNAGSQIQKDSTHRRRKQRSTKRLIQQSNVRKRSPTGKSRAELINTLESLSLTGQREPSHYNTQGSQDQYFTYRRVTSAYTSSPSGYTATSADASSLFDGVGYIRSGACLAEEGVDMEIEQSTVNLPNLNLDPRLDEGR